MNDPASPGAPLQPLPMRASKRELDGFKPGAAWDLSRYLPWLERQRAQRGAQRILLVLTAQRCDGCETLKAQLERHAELLSETLVVLAEGGDLRGRCFFGLRLEDIEIHAPGVPTALVLQPVDGGMAVVAVSLGPLDANSTSRQLVDLLSGHSRACAEAAGARLKLVSAAGARDLLPAEISGLPVRAAGA